MSQITIVALILFAITYVLMLVYLEVKYIKGLCRA